MSDLGPLVEDHIRYALYRAEAEFPAFAVDSWSEPAVPGQWVIIEDDEGRRSQVEMATQVNRGIALARGFLARQAERLVKAVLDDLRFEVETSGLIVSRPLPEPSVEGAHCSYHEFGGVWFRLLVQQSDRGPVAVLSALLGRGPKPLAEVEESVTWLEM